MSRLRSVRLLATGGTIATTTDSRTGRSAPTLGAAVADLAHKEDLAVTVEELASAPSWTLGPLDMARIARRAVAVAEDPSVDGVVITHGTTTLEYTAFLTDLFLGSTTPVILTGAMHRADAVDPDGPSNLADALSLATSPRMRGLGAVVVFAGQILAARHAWKASRTAAVAFVDLRGRPLGTIRNGHVRLLAPPGRRQLLQPSLDPRVGFVKLTPGAQPSTLDCVAPSDLRGLVVEALPGAGGVPPLVIPALRQLADRIPIVIASRAPHGIQGSVPTGGTGEPLADIGLLSAAGLSAEQAWLLLMVAVANSDLTGEDVRTIFTRVSNE